MLIHRAPLRGIKNGNYNPNLVSFQLVKHGEKFLSINDTFKRVIGILVNAHISTDILTKIASYLRRNVSIY